MSGQIHPYLVSQAINLSPSCSTTVERLPCGHPYSYTRVSPPANSFFTHRTNPPDPGKKSRPRPKLVAPPKGGRFRCRRCETWYTSSMKTITIRDDLRGFQF